jgi:hypothetical protein
MVNNTIKVLVIVILLAIIIPICYSCAFVGAGILPDGDDGEFSAELSQPATNSMRRRNETTPGYPGFQWIMLACFRLFTYTLAVEAHPSIPCLRWRCEPLYGGIGCNQVRLCTHCTIRGRGMPGPLRDGPEPSGCARPGEYNGARWPADQCGTLGSITREPEQSLIHRGVVQSPKTPLSSWLRQCPKVVTDQLAD